jgi:hypothetical protein
MYSRLLSSPSRRKAIPSERLRCRCQLVGYPPASAPWGWGTAVATAASCSTGCSCLCCSGVLRKTRTVRKPRSAPAHSIGSSSGPPCLPMTQLVGAPDLVVMGAESPRLIGGFVARQRRNDSVQLSRIIEDPNARVCTPGILCSFRRRKVK